MYVWVYIYHISLSTYYYASISCRNVWQRYLPYIRSHIPWISCHPCHLSIPCRLSRRLACGSQIWVIASAIGTLQRPPLDRAVIWWEVGSRHLGAAILAAVPLISNGSRWCLSYFPSSCWENARAISFCMPQWEHVKQISTSTVLTGASAMAMEGPKWKLAHACGPEWLSAEECAFRVWAPHGEDVTVELQGAEASEVQEVKLVREGDFWTGQARCAPGDRYRIAMGSSWNDCFHQEGARLVRRDPCARECDFNSAWCILHPPLQPLTPFVAPNFNELVIYELHVGSFVSEADEKRAFAATTEKLEHISSLGFNCIQFMPTAEFGGIWGYNSRQLLASHGPWGSAAEMRTMVERAHSLGMAVLFDVVLNHGSSKMNVLWNWDGFGPDNCGGIYFEGEKDTPWGKRFAFHKAEVQDYLKQACRTWIEEYGVDGLRFDSVHNMPWWLLQQLTYEIKAHYSNKVLIAEITPENPSVLNDAGFHSCWLHATHFDSVKIMKGSDGGGDPHKRIGMLKNMVAPHGFGNIGGVHSVLGSHDQIGDRHGGKTGWARDPSLLREPPGW